MLEIFRRDKSTNMTLPKGKTTHGIEIKKIPIGRHLEMMQSIKEMPGDMLDQLENLDIDNLIEVITKGQTRKGIESIIEVLSVAPNIVVKTLCKVFDLNYNYVSKNLTIKEFSDVVLDFWQMNDLTDFFVTAWGALQKFLTQKTGSSVG